MRDVCKKGRRERGRERKEGLGGGMDKRKDVGYYLEVGKGEMKEGRGGREDFRRV